jgi:hypothetical protein
VSRILALGLLAAAAVAGCGGGGGPKPEDQARATVQRYLTALGRGDAAAACRQFTRSSQEKLTEFGDEQLKLRNPSCAATVGAALKAGNGGAALRRLGHARITGVRLEDGHAEVTVAGLGRTTRVVKSGGAWLIDSAPTGETD